jgi:HlyD family secretion protein
MQMRAKIGLIAVAVVLAAGLAYGFMQRPVQVDIGSVTRGPLVVTVEEEGKTRVRERYVVSAPVAGFARRINLAAGDAVSAGQVIVVIEPSRAEVLDPRTRAQAEARVSAAQASLAAAQENARAATVTLRQAEQERARTESLRKSNFVSEQALDTARNTEARARATAQATGHSVKVAEYELQTARAAFANASQLQGGQAAERVDVRAPVAARVLKLVRESEGAVAAGQALLEIGNPASLEVEVEVLSTHAVKIASGSKVIIDRWGGEQPLEGRVRVVEPSGFTKVSALGVEEQRVRVIVDISSPRELWARLADGFRVEARFVLWEGDKVLQVPTSALFRQGEGWAVFTLAGDRARLAPVQIGQRAGRATEVKSGLNEGDRVLAHPDEKIGDGARVKARQ